MPNFASVLKEEITRLARKEVRAEVERLKKTAAQHRSDIADLKRRLAEQEKQVARLGKDTPRKLAVAAEGEDAGTVRFSAKGLAKHRERLGLSAGDMGALLGVSGQTVYHWEAGKTKPRQSQLAAIAGLRKMGKRVAKAELAKLKG